MWKKKFNVLFLAVVLVMAMSGCRQSQNELKAPMIETTIETSEMQTGYAETIGNDEVSSNEDFQKMFDEKIMSLNNETKSSWEMEREEINKKVEALTKYVEENGVLNGIEHICFEVDNITDGNAKVCINFNEDYMEYVDLTYDYNSEGKIWNVKIAKQYKQSRNVQDEENINPDILESQYNEQINFSNTSMLEAISNMKLVSEYDRKAMIDDIETITFGMYPKSDETGATSEPIEWIVLEKDEEKREALLLSKYILDCKQFNETSGTNSWGNCSLRKWMKDTFFNQAFNENEKEYIITKTLKDKVFVLNHKEFKKDLI